MLYKQFILWRLEKRKGKPATKVPYDVTGKHRIDPHDARNRLTYTEARQAAHVTKCGIGFVFTPNDPFFFLDIDHCYDPNTREWSPLSQSLITAFDGACLEWSQSMTGVHVFGTFTEPLEHTCKNTKQGIELYTSDRFVALTGLELYPGKGDASRDCSRPLTNVVNAYFSGNGVTPTDTPVEWTSGPITPTAGTSSPSELRRLIESMRSVRGEFTGNATPHDLFTGNEAALARSYPSSSGDTWDRSSADLALSMHLAFLTGNNCDLMQRLLFESALVRDKWIERPSYLRDTILKACANTSTWYDRNHGATNGATSGESTRTPVTEPRSNSSPMSSTPNGSPVTGVSAPPSNVTSDTGVQPGVDYMTVTQQIEFFKGHTYISDQHRVFVDSKNMFFKPESYRSTFGGHNFMVDPTGRPTKNAFEALTESKCHRFGQADTAIFKPDLEPGMLIIDEQGRKSLNVFIPRWGARVTGSADPMYEHIARLIPDPVDQAVFLSWQAALIQFPGIKIPWAIVLQGIQGNGKSTIIKALRYAIDSFTRQYTYKLDANDLTNKFNAWIFGKILIWCEEIWTAGRMEVANILKPMITDDVVTYQAKGQDQRTIENCANFFFNSNKRDAVLKTANDRRYAVFYAAQQDPEDMIACGMDRNSPYFDQLYGWLENHQGYAIWANELATYSIPASIRIKGQAPLTTSTEAAIRESGGVAEHLILEAIESGEPGFTGDLIAVSDAVDLLAQNNRRYSPQKVGSIIRSLGYQIHPALRDQAKNRLQFNGRKYIIYAKVGSLVNQIMTSDTLRDKWQSEKTRALMNVHNG